jgi:hypothetical protein
MKSVMCMLCAGDGRNDSPGFSAQYCTYTLMDVENCGILALAIVDKRECALKSTNMEKLGLQRAMAELTSKDLVIKELVTDAHPQIRAMMSKSRSSSTEFLVVFNCI